MLVNSQIVFLNEEQFKTCFASAKAAGCSFVYSDTEDSIDVESADNFIELSRWVQNCSLFVTQNTQIIAAIYFETVRQGQQYAVKMQGFDRSKAGMVNYFNPFTQAFLANAA